MAAKKSAIGSALLLGMPEGSDESEEDMDVGADREEAAAKAFMSAVKGSDPAAVVRTYRELKDACEAAGGYEEEPEEV